ncbi:hypothetical protein WKI13_03285 [Teredinibacter turnerae]|uniref:hypothetical protein n=1 Tax=Teredinibacter turnerae TaxID=2426 RepID=UPI00036675D5|nr:hypothetical protein [Teredinibacter turnerae]
MIVKVFSTKPALIITAATLMLGLAGCKAGWEETETEDETDTPTDPTELATNFFGLGPYRRLEFTEQENDEDSGTFNLVSSVKAGDTTTLSASGDFEILSSGFGQLTVTSVSTGSDVSVDDEITFIKLKNSLTIVAPLKNSNNQIVPLINADHCSTSDINNNWVLFQQADNFDVDADNEGKLAYYGTFGWKNTSSNTDITSYDSDGEQAGDALSLSESTCEEGRAVNTNHRYFLTNAKTVLLEIGESADAITAGTTTNSQFAIGLERKKLAALSDTNGTYIGYLTNSNDGAYFPVKAECTDGTCEFNQMTDVENGSLDNDNTYTLALLESKLNDPGNGMIAGDLTLPDSNTAGATFCTFNNDYNGTGIYFMACAGLPPGEDDNGQHTNLFLMTQP